MKKKTEKALICAEKIVAADTYPLRPYRLKKAILSFLALRDFPDKFCGSAAVAAIESGYLKYWVRGDTVLAGPIFGGPLCAVVMEELAACGVKSFIGYGASGTMDASVPPCSIMVADAGLNSDGTTREYTRKREIPGDPGLIKLLQDAVRKRGLPVFTGKVWTTDAIYREYPSKVALWKGKGARFVNMETSAFYAVAQALGVKAGYLSAVSDNVSGEDWSGWYPDFRQVMTHVYDICLEVIDAF
jgi:purine-nucleoside phosphorylase